MVVGTGLISAYLDSSASETGEKVKVMTTGSEIMEVDKGLLKLPHWDNL